MASRGKRPLFSAVPCPEFRNLRSRRRASHNPVTRQEEEARGERRNGLKQPGATTRPIATGHELTGSVAGEETKT